jgi:2-amino-4-hydroxy-6-hydroxymethyldihydropteridine diphosphokinase
MLVHINIGSNENKEQNIQKALELLQQKFGELQISKTYTTPAVGFKGADFDNIGVNFDSSLEAVEIINILHQIEDDIGRDRSKPKFSSRTIDLDLVFYGDKIIKELNIPRDDILKYDFVLQPFMELCYANFNKYN